MPDAPESVSQPTPPAPLPPSSKKGALLGVFSIVFLLVLIGTGVVYGVFYQDRDLPLLEGERRVALNRFLLGLPLLPKPPSQVLKEALSRSEEPKSFAFDGRVDVDGSAKVGDGIAPQEIGVTLKLAGEVDRTLPLDERARGTIGADVSFEGLGVTTAVDWVTLGQDRFFVKINELPAMLSVTPLGQFAKKWYEISPNFLKSELREMGMNATTQEEITFSQEAQERLSNFIQKMGAGIFSRQEMVGEEKISGADTFHYRLALSSDAVRALVAELLAIAEAEAQKRGETGGQSLSQMMADFDSEAGEFLRQIESWPIDLWVGKNDFHTYKVAFSGIVPSPSAESGSMRLNASLTFSRFGQRMSIEAPVGAEIFSLKMLMEQLGGGVPFPPIMPLVGSDTGSGVGGGFEGVLGAFSGQ